MNFPGSSALLHGRNGAMQKAAPPSIHYLHLQAYSIFLDLCILSIGSLLKFGQVHFSDSCDGCSQKYSCGTVFLCEIV